MLFLELHAALKPVKPPDCRVSFLPEHPDFDHEWAVRRAGVTPEVLPDLSLIYRLNFDCQLPVEPVLSALKRLIFITWAEPATDVERHIVKAAASTFSLPNDRWYREGMQWELDKVYAAEAWQMSQGRMANGKPITIGIFDAWRSLNNAPHNVHPDLGYDPYLASFRLSVRPDHKDPRHFGSNYGGHGLNVASIAGAITNNGRDMASLGWGVRLLGYWYFLHNIPQAVEEGVRVLSISALFYDRPRLREYIKYALASGVVVVAAAGNHIALEDGVNYPAALHFDDLDAQVIAVSATDALDLTIDTFVKSPGKDPIRDPERAFIDVAAPGVKVRVLETFPSREVPGTFTYTTRTASGTSLAAPMVSSLAALLLAVEPKLTVQDVYHLITYYADRVGPYEYDENGWSRELGYGRINAARSLESLIRHPEAWIHIESGKRKNLYVAEHHYGVPPFSYLWEVKDTRERSIAAWRVISRSRTCKLRSNDDHLLRLTVTDAAGKVSIRMLRTRHPFANPIQTADRSSANQPARH